MSTVITRPSSYVGTDPGATGTALAVTAMSDQVDGTYVNRDLNMPAMTFEVGNPTKPAGSMTKSVQASCKVQPTSGSCRFGFWINSPIHYKNTGGSPNNVATAIGTFNGPISVELGDLSQADLNQLRYVCSAVYPTNSVVRFVEGFVQYVFAEQPTTTIITPTGTISTNTPTLTWSHTPGTDGGPQQWFQYLVFTAAQYNGAGFSPDTTPAEIASGPWASSQQSVVTAPLPSGAIRIYVRTAQNVNGNPHWAPWDFEAITVSLTTSEVLAVSPVAYSDEARVLTAVPRNTGTDAWHHIELQRNTATDEFASIGQFTTGAGGIGTGWVAYQFGAPTATSRSLVPVAGRGNVQRIAATVTNTSTFGLEPAAPLDAVACEEGDQVEFSLDIAGTFAATTRFNLMTWFLNAGGATIVDLRTQHTPVTSANYSRIYHTTTAPAGTASVVAFFEGTASTGTAAAFTADVDEVRLVCNGTWIDVPDVPTNLPAANSGAWNDYLAPPDVPIRYRARAVKADGTMGSWIEQIGTTTWVPAKVVWIKSAADPTISVAVDLQEFPNPEEPIDQGVFWPLAAADVPVVYPVIIAEPRQSRQGSWLIRCRYQEHSAQLRAVLATGLVLVQAPAILQFATGYFAIGNIRESTYTDRATTKGRNWAVDFIEVDRP